MKKMKSKSMGMAKPRIMRPSSGVSKSKSMAGAAMTKPEKQRMAKQLGKKVAGKKKAKMKGY